MIILGIDPGSRTTGFGLIQSQKGQAQYLACGCIRTQSDVLAERLQSIYQGITDLVQQYRPDTAAIESVFMHRNADSALKLGHARGAAMVACSNHSLSIAEYTARQIKQSVVGYGNADKSQVQHMVCQLLQLSGPIQADAADALAVALYHQYTQQGMQRLGAFSGRIRRGRVR